MFNNSGLAARGNLFAHWPVCALLPPVATFTSNMCGIVGYVGRSEAAPILLEGLRRLEYRGYDSAGVAIVNGDQLETRKCAGRIASLAKLISKKPATGSYGISHTRWATHGKVTDENAHPHFDASGKIALVHNGVIENYQALKEQLVQNGDTKFRSDTDTEVLAHLIGSVYQQLNGKDTKARLVNATRAALKQVIGTYGIAVMHADIPDFIVGARRGSPLVLGVGKDENFLASDVSAIVAHTRDVVYLNDFDLVSLDRENFEISSIDGAVGQHAVSKVEFTAEDIKKGDYPHYMLKEICEQPDTVRDAMRGRLTFEECTAKLGGLNMNPAELRDITRVVLTGCGTALHAGRVGEYTIEQLAILTLIGLLLGRMRQLSTAQGKRIIDALEALPGQIEQVLKLSDQIKSIAKKYVDVSGMLFFGRQFNYPIALEGALKLKEITYLFAEGHPSAELKHGIIALVRPDLPSIFIAPDDAVFSKNVNNMEQVKARKGPIIAITSGDGANKLKDLAADIIEVPNTIDCLSPVLTVIPLQLLAYHLAVALGRDVDKPRNLAKSVTVE